ncbi:alanine/glycine:cation symporter family protein [Halalkalibacter akibai]|uniref:Probable amino acid carrier protein n=1 Tax=Halalkalibacter akibai (strain ATCC 43226 / DSM 21942 / CIP 109018 / JCM 9157 / 1139) TaxID=1236973 RepID=W4QZF0_HALA3|nr:alanine/glycine:cation symporter family protein [Halalkalibacter akibai]GAE37292.1 probable amino acid carrier protein [Halalkalibacter akibai JCM 9157]
MDFISNIINNIVSVGNDILWSYLLIALLIIAGIYFTVASRFVQFRYIGEMFRLLTDKETVSTGKKTVSSFQAFCISTASRVGTGNLAGVASAIALGGPGAIFWMWVIALLGSATAFVESTLAQIYKVKDGDGFRGGPAYYMEKALGARWLGIIFAILITFCFGLVFNSVQSNTIAAAMNGAFDSNTTVVGVIVAVLTAVIIFGGVHRIAKVTAIVVPVMALIYLVVAFVVIIMNIPAIPSVFALIFQSAFGLEQAIGGGIGAAMMMGIKRGLFSNEAGMGSAPNAAATAHVSHPAKQGLIQSLGVFVDTLIICSATAFIILISGDFASGAVGIELTQNALASQIGDWASIFVAIAIFLFAFSSIIGNYYYGETNIEFIKKSKLSIMIYRLAAIGMVLFGATAEFSLVWDMADLTMGLMALMNILVIFLLGKFAFATLTDYGKQRKAGKNPVFFADSVPGLKNVEHWKKDTSKQEGK